MIAGVGSDSYEVRLAASDDADAIVALMHDSYAEYRGRLQPPSGAHAETMESVASLLCGEFCYVAQAGADLVGCVFYTPRESSVYMHRLCVLPAWRRHGIGRTLIESVENAARSLVFDWVSLACRIALPQNWHYYERLGYRIVAFTSHAGFTQPTSLTMRKRVGVSPVRAVTIEEWNPAWLERYAAASVELRALLGETLLDIHAIGSTAVRGLAARPTIDLLAYVPSLTAVESNDPELLHAGWEPWGEHGIKGRRLYCKGTDEQHTHRLHVFTPGHPDAVAQLVLVEYLTSHPDEVETYAKVKREAALAHTADVAGYMNAKDAFGTGLQTRALAWRARK
jgi:GrpB-like predicted nucleotidyltransferase (UPF0157 family)/GNAT superfamily N-acetyltransferase